MKLRDNYWFWISSGVLCAFLATLTMQFVSPLAKGSGIPQMRAIMAGVRIDGFLDIRTCISKILGIMFMLCSGMSLGKEGPFVHIAGCIADSLPYRELSKNKTLRH